MGIFSLLVKRLASFLRVTSQLTHCGIVSQPHDVNIVLSCRVQVNWKGPTAGPNVDEGSGPEERRKNNDGVWHGGQEPGHPGRTRHEF